ncbi:MAG TPA: NAD-dependent epimerase/dehydratase family protein [Candidatus Thermoplasmatota archaeon]|nr:NAD-dependent epimerase/dehydratase family protein [Candidatus Thermoplasmatota archaeon]
MVGAESVLVTGGAGFIGSHLIDRLLADGHRVRCYDNFTSGKREFLAHHAKNPNLQIIGGDVMERAALAEAMKGVDLVFHLAANPDVRIGATSSRIHLDQNVIATYEVLEAMRAAGVRRLGFTSTSTVYGETDRIPTPEDFGPLFPISLYGASKLACEALISGYAHTFDFETVSYRFANVVGPRSTHGVTYDFYHKLRADPKRLEILGDGRQKKSYVHVSDTVEAMVHTMRMAKAKAEVFNIGSRDAITVTEIANLVVAEMGLKDVTYHFTGGVDGGRGWKGDVKVMRLDTSKLERTGWHPKMGSAESIAATARALVDEGKKAPVK